MLYTFPSILIAFSFSPIYKVTGFWVGDSSYPLDYTDYPNYSGPRVRDSSE
ncbi:hypothetical protein [Flavobacterium sp. LS1P3]|jgi:hypothetical protein|uniref:hypothetical protein n=1 Tax=Flavobacterium sp. LS1P3 TaxID=3401720 RepID=UPI003AAB8C90